MRAFKCDVCGKYFDEPVNIPGPSIMYASNRWADLCKDCYIKFLKFMGDNEYVKFFDEEDNKSNSIFNDRGKEMLRKIGADKETVTEGYLGKV